MAASAWPSSTAARSLQRPGPKPDGTLVKALARAWRWQKLLDTGLYTTVAEIAEAERISKSYISWILRLALAGAHIVEATLGTRSIMC